MISTVDADVKIQVGNSTIILNGATGKTININGKKIPTSDTPTDTKNDEVVILPPFWYDNTRQLLGTSGNDSIHNTLDSIVITALNGNDNISNDGANVTIDGGDGNDRIYNSRYGNNTSIIGSIGDDSIGNYGENATIAGGEGSDSIDNFGDNATIDGDSGDDTIYNDDPGDPVAGLNVMINAGSGNDVISNDILVL